METEALSIWLSNYAINKCQTLDSNPTGPNPQTVILLFLGAVLPLENALRGDEDKEHENVVNNTKIQIFLILEFPMVNTI